jgi:uncharacterized protein
LAKEEDAGNSILVISGQMCIWAKAHDTAVADRKFVQVLEEVDSVTMLVAGRKL